MNIDMKRLLARPRPPVPGQQGLARYSTGLYKSFCPNCSACLASFHIKAAYKGYKSKQGNVFIKQFLGFKFFLLFYFVWLLFIFQFVFFVSFYWKTIEHGHKIC